MKVFKDNITKSLSIAQKDNGFVTIASGGNPESAWNDLNEELVHTDVVTIFSYITTRLNFSAADYETVGRALLATALAKLTTERDATITATVAATKESAEVENPFN